MPSTLTQSFKSAHQAIIVTIDQILPNMRSYNKAKPPLRELNAQLLAHFGRQDQKMLDVLTEKYKNNREASKMLEFLIHDLKDKKIKYLLFFDQYSGELGDASPRNFSRDFQQFIGEIIDRIKIEEEYLLPLLQELPSGTLNESEK